MYDWIWNSPNLEKLAQEYFRRYIATLHELIIKKNINIDLLVVGGNTGLVMGRWTQIFFDIKGINRPKLIHFTTQRYIPNKEETDENLFDNSILKLSAYNQLYDNKTNSVKNILFVDDEIGLGKTAEACLKALHESNVLENNANFYIIAEDQGYNVNNKIKDVSIKFYPFATEIEGLNNIITYIIPNKIDQQIKKVFKEEEISSCGRIQLLMGLPSRNKNIFMDGFDYKNNQEAEGKINNMDILRKEFKDYIENLVKSTLVEVEEGKIDLNSFDTIKSLLKCN